MGEIVKAGSIELDVSRPAMITQALSRSAMIVHNVDPEKQAENNQKMVDLGVPKAFATPATHDANTDEIKRVSEEFGSLSGYVARRMADPEFAKIASDDAPNLSLWEDGIVPLVRGIAATPEVIAATATGFSAFILSGWAGIFAPVVGVDQGEAITKTAEALTYRPKQTEAQEGVEHLGKALHIFKKVGDVSGGIVELMTTLDLEKASEVIKGDSPGSNVLVPFAASLGEAGAMLLLPEAVKGVKTHLTKVVEVSKASKVRVRDGEAYKEFTDNASEGHPPVKVPAEKVDEILSNANKTPEEMLSDPVTYYEKKLVGEQVELPVSDIAKMSDNIKPEDINEMSLGDIPSVKDIETKLEIAKAKDARPEVIPGEVPALPPKGPSGKILPDTKGEMIEVGKPPKGPKAKKTELPDGEIKESQLAERAEADAIEKKLTEDLGDLATYKTMNMKEQAELAQNLLDSNYAKAKRIAMGLEEAPEGLRTASVYEAVKIRALEKGDIATIQKLATESSVPTRLSELGQEIKAADSKAEMDPVRDAQDVIKTRKERVKRTGKKPSTEKTVATSGKKLKKARQKLVKHDEKASKKKIKEFIKEHEEVIGTRQTRKNVRAVGQGRLQAEFKGLSAELNSILSPTKLSAGIDPTAIPVLIKMAKNRIEAGIITVEGLVDSIYFEIKDLADITKRDVRDAVSGYGKTTKPTSKEPEATLRELKGQARLISALEDAQKGEPPLRSGYQRDAISDKVRALQKEIKEEMRKSGVETTSPEQQLKTALDTVKTRLRNQISDLTKQLETGEKTPKKTGIKYDEEANALRAERDTLKNAIEEIEGKPQMTDEQRIKVAVSAVKKSITEYNRRIKAKELVTPKGPSKTPETPELKALRTARDKLKEELNQMRKDAKPPKDPDATRLKTFKTRVTNEIAKIEGNIDRGDFTKPERGTTNLDAEGQKLKSEVERLRKDQRNLAEASDTITKEEITELVNLSKEAARAKAAMEQGGDRFAYGAAVVKYDNYVDKLHLGDDTIAGLLRDRAAEFKTTAKEFAPKAIADLGVDTLKTITDNSIATVAAVDNSFLGRQGIGVLMTHPTAWYPAAAKSFADFAKTLGGKATMDAVRADIYSRPNYIDGKYQKANIIAKTEEQFPANLPGRLPVVGRVFKASESAFVGTGLRMRADLFDLYERMATKNGVDTSNAVWLEDAGSLTNSLTARGKWGKRGEPAIVRLLLWAPKMLKANLDVMTAHGAGVGFKSNWARKQAAKNVLKIVGETAVALMIADQLVPGSVEWNPKSSDFGKIKVGDTRFDITAGKASIVTLAARLVTNSKKSTATGLVAEYGSGYGEATRQDAFLDFLTNKFTPPAATVNQWLKGETREGGDVTLGEAVSEGFLPISVQNFLEFGQEPTADGLAGAIVDLWGTSANTYRDDTIRTRDMISRVRKDKPFTSEQAKAYEKMTDKQKNHIDKQASMTAMQAGFSNLSIDNKIYAWSNASPSERDELSDIYDEAVSNHIKGLDYEDDIIEFNKKIDAAEIK